jgi:hypothetical protein
MRINDILDLHSVRFRKFDVAIDVISLRVHDRGLPFARSTEDVSGTAGLVIEILFEDHTRLEDSFLTHFFFASSLRGPLQCCCQSQQVENKKGVNGSRLHRSPLPSDDNRL